jgi:small GTP-binding protein
MFSNNIDKTKDDNINENQSYKIIFLGDSGVGKTSIIRKFFHPDISYNPISTVFVDHYSYLHNNHKITFIDTAGQERFDSLTPSYLRKPSLVILIYDSNNADTFRHIIHKWISLVESNNPHEIINYFVIANKVDLLHNFEEHIKISDPYIICQEKKIPFHFCSIKDINLIKNLFNSICQHMEIIIENDKYVQSNNISFTQKASNLLSSITSSINIPFTRTPDLTNKPPTLEDYVQELIGKTEKNDTILTTENIKDNLENTKSLTDTELSKHHSRCCYI